MRDAIFILFVALILFGLTAIRYRKQIAALMGVARLLNDTKNAAASSRSEIRESSQRDIPLVNCTGCGVWIPQNKARRLGDLFYCSDECLKTRV